MGKILHERLVSVGLHPASYLSVCLKNLKDFPLFFGLNQKFLSALLGSF